MFNANERASVHFCKYTKKNASCKKSFQNKRGLHKSNPLSLKLNMLPVSVEPSEFESYFSITIRQGVYRGIVAVLGTRVPRNAAHQVVGV